MTQRAETPAPATTTYVTDEGTGILLGQISGTAHYGECYRLPVSGAPRGSRADYLIVQVCHPTTHVRTAVARRVVD